jgi:hypothetical protein
MAEAPVFYRSVNWDNVGNLYAGSQTLARWRMFSPPGTNQATTVALATIQVTSAIQISNIALAGGPVTVDFTGSTSDSPNSFKLQGSSAVEGTYTDLGSANITQSSPGVFQATVAASGSPGFYRIKRE